MEINGFNLKRLGREMNLKLPSRIVLWFTLGMWWMLPGVAAGNDVEEARRLLGYAEMLGEVNEVVFVDEEGVLIAQGQLLGAQVLRPSAARSRAAEMLMEAAVRQNSLIEMEETMQIWRSLGDYRSPVGYLRRVMASARKGSEHWYFARWNLAQCYLQQGDDLSAARLYAESGEEIGERTNAAILLVDYARFLIDRGELQEGERLARKVAEEMPRDGLIGGRGRNDPYGEALAVLALLPTLSTSGQVARTGRESRLLAEAEAQPVYYLQLGRESWGIQDYSKTVEYFTEYLRNYPDRPEAREAALRIGEAQLLLGDEERALNQWRTVVARYSEYPEAVEAIARAVDFHQEHGREREAMQFLAYGRERIQSAGSLARLLLMEAEIHAGARRVEEAAHAYVRLMREYGGQDAADQAMERLGEVAPGMRNWRRFTREIQDWLTAGDGFVGSESGQSVLNPRRTSDLRRMCLGLFVANDQYNSGLSWLKAVGERTPEREHDWVVRDEAWFYSEFARAARRQSGQLGNREMARMLRLGVSAWQIAPDTEEGFQGLREAHRLAMRQGAQPGEIRMVADELQELLGTSYHDRVVEMLVRLYEFHGDDRALRDLRAGGGL